MNPHILLAVSAHGYGHLSQVSPVINALRQHSPEIRLTVQGDFPHSVVTSRIEGYFDHLKIAADVVFAMHGPTEINWPTTQRWFQEFHRNWHDRVEAETRRLKQLKVDLVIADIPYLTLAAAKQAAIPAVAYSSLNWVDTLLENPKVSKTLKKEIAQMRTAYACADYFIQPEPSIPMTWLDQYHSTQRFPIAPVSASPRNRRKELNQTLQLNPKSKLVLVSLGGIPMDRALLNWPKLSDVNWIVDSSGYQERSDIYRSKPINWPFPDLIGSADLLVTKPGYGTFTEAARCGVPVLNIAREDWAESRYLIHWLEKIVAINSVSLNQAYAGDIAAEVTGLLAQGHRRGVETSGIEAAVELLLAKLQSG